MGSEMCIRDRPYMNVYKDTDEPYIDPGNAPEESGVSDVPVSEPATTGSN